MTIDELMEKAGQQEGLNPELLRATAAMLRADPKHCDQGTYVDERFSCGTIACIAGHGLLAAGLSWAELLKMGEDDEEDRIGNLAMELFGLTDDESCGLFAAYPTSWPHQYRQRFEAARNDRSVQALVAADLLDALADGRVKPEDLSTY